MAVPRTPSTAGPGGGTADKPVGTVWLAYALRSQEGPQTRTECVQFTGERCDVREQTVLHALRALLDLVHE